MKNSKNVPTLDGKGRYRWVLVAGALLGLGSVEAQTIEEVSEKDFLTDMPIVLSVSRLPQRLDETPGAVTLIDREAIRRSGARDVSDLMRLVPGFQVSASFESVAPLASYHGAFDSYSNRLELLIDGRSAYSSYVIGSIGPGLQTLALDDIERIEVLRGSNSAAYGARAILGVINIVTRHTADTLGARGSISAGENGISDLMARVGWGDDRASFRLTTDLRSDDGLVGSNGANQVKRVNFRSDLRPTAQDDVQVRLGSLSIDAGKGFVGNVDDPVRPTFFDTHYAQLDWKRTLGVDADLALKLSHTRESYTDNYLYSLARFGINDFFSVSGDGYATADSVSLQHTFRQGASVRVVWGGEFRRESTVSIPIYATDSALVTDFTRLFGNLEWRISPTLLLNGGLMAEHSSVTGDNLAPRLMLNWHMAEGQTWRVGISKAFRPPSNYEKFANVRYVYKGILLGLNTVSSGRVDSEQVLAREIGYLGDFPRWGFSIDARAFHEQIDGFIRQKNDTRPRDYANDENFAIKGLELQAKWKPWRGAEIVLNQSYTHIGAVTNADHVEYPNYYSGTPFAAPRMASSLSFFQKLPSNMDLTLTHHDIGTTTLAGSGHGCRVAMTRTDVRLSKALRWGNRQGELALVVQNIGLPYQDFDPSFTFKRAAFVTLTLEN